MKNKHALHSLHPNMRPRYKDLLCAPPEYAEGTNDQNRFAKPLQMGLVNEATGHF